MKNELIEVIKDDQCAILSDDDIKNEIDAMLDVSDEEIQESLEDAMKEQKKVGRKKLASTVQADTIVSAFLKDKSDENWKDLQEFFWYGIKQFAYKYVKDSCRDPNDVADVVYDMTIETFINAYQNIESYDPDKAKFSTWLWTICRNNCLGYLKKKSRIPIVQNDISEIYDSEIYSESSRRNQYAQNHSEFENGTFNGPEFESCDFSEVTKSLYDVSVAEIGNIPGIGGQILHMKLVDNMKIREIAVKLSMNESTVKNYLYRGKENLKRILTINHRDLVDEYKDMNDAIDNAQFNY